VAALTGVPHCVQNTPLTEAPQVVQKAMNYSSILLTVRLLAGFSKQSETQKRLEKEPMV